MVFVIQKRTCYTNGYDFRYNYCYTPKIQQLYRGYIGDSAGVLKYILASSWPPPPTRKLYIYNGLL